MRARVVLPQPELADDAEHLALAHVEIDAGDRLQHRGAGEQAAADAKRAGEAAHLDERLGHGATAAAAAWMQA